MTEDPLRKTAFDSNSTNMLILFLILIHKLSLLSGNVINEEYFQSKLYLKRAPCVCGIFDGVLCCFFHRCLAH